MKFNKTASTRQSRMSHTFAQAVSSRRFLLVILALAAVLTGIWGGRLGEWRNGRVLAAAQANFVVALAANNQLLQFSASSPNSIISATTVTGLKAGDSLVGIDYRPATGQLYALAANGALGRLYTINPLNGAASAVGTGFALPQSAGAGAGKDYGFDFNPTVDRIRVVADSRDNFRAHPDTGAAVSPADFPLSPGATVTGVAYDRNFGGSKVTTLYAIDPNADQLVTIGGIDSAPSPNGGVVRPVGFLGVNASNDVGFDITVGAEGSAYASLTVNGKSGFYTIDLKSGAATLVGTIGNGGVAIRDIAAAPAGALLPTSLAFTVWALDASNKLISFRAAETDKISAPKAVTGLQAAEKLVGIDFRPANGQLYALAVNGALGRLYTINPQTGAASAIGTGFPMPQSAGAGVGKDYGFDFNPTVDRIRVVADSRDNFRAHPDTGAAVTPADFALSPGAAVTGVAYDRNFGGSKVTTLYAIDPNTDQLVTIGGIDSAPSPNGGVIRPVGPLGVNASNDVGFDISVGPEGAAFAVLTVNNQPGLYSIYLPSGLATLVKTLNVKTPIIDIAIAPVGAGQ